MVRSITRFAVLAIVFLTVPAASLAIEGTYDCVGQNPKGDTYRGTVVIEKFGDSYELRWRIGNSTHVGVGFIENDRLCSSWAVSTNSGVLTGVVVYRIESGQLIGRWSQFPGKGGIYSETLTRRN